MKIKHVNMHPSFFPDLVTFKKTLILLSLYITCVKTSRNEKGNSDNNVNSIQVASTEAINPVNNLPSGNPEFFANEEEMFKKIMSKTAVLFEKLKEARLVNSGKVDCHQRETTETVSNGYLSSHEKDKIVTGICKIYEESVSDISGNNMEPGVLSEPLVRMPIGKAIDSFIDLIVKLKGAAFKTPEEEVCKIEENNEIIENPKVKEVDNFEERKNKMKLVFEKITSFIDEGRGIDVNRDLFVFFDKIKELDDKNRDMFFGSLTAIQDKLFLDLSRNLENKK